MDPTEKTIWGYIREKFPPARAVAFLSPIAITVAAAVTTYVVNHFPYLADQINGDWVTGLFLTLVAGGVGLAYKWLDGRAKWETSQVAANVALVQAGKLPVSAVTNGNEVAAKVEMDDDMILSMPADIDETDSDPGSAPEREDRGVYDGPDKVGD